MDKVVVEEKGSLAIIILNRPEVLNCFDYDMLQQLDKTIRNLQRKQDIHVVIFTGSGEKAFSAGADLKERRGLSEAEVRRNVNKIRRVFLQIDELPQTTIAAINGHAFGGGFELALACDLRIAVNDAMLGLTEVSWGIIPGAGGTQRLARLVGPAKAKELILTARRIEAKVAERWGIINSVVEHGELMDQASSLADEILANAPLAVNQAKFAIDKGSNIDLHSGLAIEANAYESIIPTQDRIEALLAFKEKRKPKFQGK
ncbi:enoyl-CoA hydratase-related protein [Virgibacillus sp. M23]|uniref:enoyl-CoA hydratase-related protein n=1 Tax=Virgibacillus sp. M23 TaxID=3079030 RepID=UPI002A90CF41|nr:enoyl-CoA hydratase-related protein [Virgibacillus sp. M23]MDY7043785.1 enoyl-CoA hydratase-related protein [Virgibacillus sp. M23]